MTSREKAALGVSLVVVLASLFVFVHPWYDATNDGSTYILTARSLAAGEGYTYLGQMFRMRPPGFSALLSLISGAHGPNFRMVNLLVSLFGVAGIVLLYFWQRPHLGWVLALLTSLAVWFNPGYQRLCNQVMSDVPGLALLLGCLLLDRWASRRQSWRREVLLGLAISVSAYLRSITILLVPALILARLLGHKHPGTDRSASLIGRLAVVVVTVWLVLLPWQVAKRQNAPPPPADQTLNYSISTAMWHVDPGDPGSERRSLGSILARVPTRLQQVALVVGSRMQYRIPGSPSPSPAVAFGRTAFALLLTAGLCIALARRRSAAEWVALATLGVVAIYFVFTDRLILPFFVFALAATVEVLRDLAGRFGGPRAATWVPAGALLLLIAIDMKPHKDWRTIAERHREFASVAASVESILAPDARLAAGQGFHYGVYLDRPVVSLVHAVRRAHRRDAAEQIIDRYGVNTVVLSPLIEPDRRLAPYFIRRYGPGEPAGEARVWRVRP